MASVKIAYTAADRALPGALNTFFRCAHNHGVVDAIALFAVQAGHRIPNVRAMLVQDSSEASKDVRARDAERARLDAEAMFGSSPSQATTPLVILKRRRSFGSQGPTEGPVKPPEEARAPRVHRLVARVEVVGSLGRLDQGADLSTGPAGEGPAPWATPVRRRRHTHGPVTVTTPSNIADVGSIGASSVAFGLGDAQTTTSAVEAFYDKGTARQYARLLNRIAQLQAKADELRKSEAVEAVHWIRRAIQDYGLTPGQLGLRDHCQI